MDQKVTAASCHRSTASLKNLQLRLAGTTVVGESSVTITVDAFGVRLWGE